MRTPGPGAQIETSRQGTLELPLVLTAGGPGQGGEGGVLWAAEAGVPKPDLPALDKEHSDWEVGSAQKVREGEGQLVWEQVCKAGQGSWAGL